MFKEISIILSIIALALASCPANPKIDGLLSGKSLFYSDSIAFNVNPNVSSTSQNYIYAFPQNLASTPSIALGTNPLI